MLIDTQTTVRLVYYKLIMSLRLRLAKNGGNLGVAVEMIIFKIRIDSSCGCLLKLSYEYSNRCLDHLILWEIIILL